VEVGDRVIAYTGDTEWTDEVACIAVGADLLIAECYGYARPIKWHLNHPAIVEHVRAAGARRVILTHMSAEMLAHRGDVPEECAADGMVVEV
jgi:ribonuclease BN (tRNA processing enzyme)